MSFAHYNKKSPVFNQFLRTQEQNPTNQIPQNEINVVKTADIALPTFYEATEGFKHCRNWYGPLLFIYLTYGMDEIVNDYNEQF